MPVKNNAAVDPRSKPRSSWGAVAAKRKRKRKPTPGRNTHQPVRRPAVRPNTSRLRRGTEPVSTLSIWARGRAVGDVAAMVVRACCKTRSAGLVGRLGGEPMRLGRTHQPTGARGSPATSREVSPLL